MINNKYQTGARLLKGIPIKNKILLDLKQKVAGFVEARRTRPAIGIVQIGNNPRSDVYIHKKKTFGHEIGVIVHHVQLPESATYGEIETEILELAEDEDVHGILIQMPLPKHISPKEMQVLMDLIPQKKDVDGLTTKNIDLLTSDYDHAILPATARAVNLLLDGYDIPISEKKVVVIGRSNLVGRPTAISLEHRGADVTVCHSQSINIPTTSKKADILVVATGVPNLVTSQFTNPNQTIVDVGISVLLGSDNDNKIVGDVDFKNVAPIVKNISPVPGGVGPLTVAALFLNLMDCYNNQA